jgi:uncharacterized protein (UPF0261 family)
VAARTSGGVRRLGRALACLAVLAGAVARAEAAVGSGLKLTLEERYDDDLLLRAAPGAGGQRMTKVAPEGRLSPKVHGTVTRIAQVGARETVPAVELTRNVVSVRAVLTAWE